MEEKNWQFLDLADFLCGELVGEFRLEFGLPCSVVRRRASNSSWVGAGGQTCCETRDLLGRSSPPGSLAGHGYGASKDFSLRATCLHVLRNVEYAVSATDKKVVGCLPG